MNPLHPPLTHCTDPAVIGALMPLRRTMNGSETSINALQGIERESAERAMNVAYSAVKDELIESIASPASAAPPVVGAVAGVGLSFAMGGSAIRWGILGAVAGAVYRGAVLYRRWKRVDALRQARDTGERLTDDLLTRIGFDPEDVP